MNALFLMHPITAEAALNVTNLNQWTPIVLYPQRRFTFTNMQPYAVKRARLLKLHESAERLP